MESGGKVCSKFQLWAPEMPRAPACRCPSSGSPHQAATKRRHRALKVATGGLGLLIAVPPERLARAQRGAEGESSLSVGLPPHPTVTYTNRPKVRELSRESSSPSPARGPHPRRARAPRLGSTEV